MLEDQASNERKTLDRIITLLRDNCSQQRVLYPAVIIIIIIITWSYLKISYSLIMFDSEFGSISSQSHSITKLCILFVLLTKNDVHVVQTWFPFNTLTFNWTDSTASNKPTLIYSVEISLILFYTTLQFAILKTIVNKSCYG